MKNSFPESAEDPAGTSAPDSGLVGKTDEDPDAELVQQVCRGQVEAFDELVRRHQDRVFTRVYLMVRDRELAADLTQEAFVKAYQNIGTFRWEARFGTWLGRIALNAALHHFERSRAQKRSANVVSIHGLRDSEGDESTLEIADESTSPVDRAVRNEQKSAILIAVEELDDEFRVALTLRELEGYSYMEIAAALGIPIGTVKSKIFRARQILQEKLKDIL